MYLSHTRAINTADRGPQGQENSLLHPEDGYLQLVNIYYNNMAARQGECISYQSPGTWKEFGGVAEQVKMAISHHAGMFSRYYTLRTVPQ